MGREKDSQRFVPSAYSLLCPTLYPKIQRRTFTIRLAIHVDVDGLDAIKETTEAAADFLPKLNVRFVVIVWWIVELAVN